MSVMELTPLGDSDYEPRHPPENGQIPDVVIKWGKRSQLRWFKRFARDLHPRQAWGQYWCESEHHRGVCCGSCEADVENMVQFGYSGGVKADGWCCCRDSRQPGGTA